MKLHRWADIKNRKMTPGRVATSDTRVALAALAIRVDSVRKAAGLTHEELGRRAMLSQSQLCKDPDKDAPPRSIPDDDSPF
jgi:hypothetical protein